MLISKKTPKRVVLELGKIDCRERKCSHCCRYGSGYVLKEEVPKIARFLKIKPKELKQEYLEEAEKFNTKQLRFKTIKQKGKAYGPCVFLKEPLGCIINDVKPLHCLIGSCGMHGSELQKWFDLNYFINPADPESIRQYAIYLDFNEPLPGGKLEELVPNQRRLKKILNYEML